MEFVGFDEAVSHPEAEHKGHALHRKHGYSTLGDAYLLSRQIRVTYGVCCSSDVTSGGSDRERHALRRLPFVMVNSTVRPETGP